MSDAATRSQVRECPGCGQFQVVDALAAGITARCLRCGTVLRSARRHPLNDSLALTLGSLMLLTVMCLTTLMRVSTAGIEHQAGLLSGPVELVARGMSGLAAVVVFVTLLAPYGKLLGRLYVLLGVRLRRPPRHLRRVFLASEWLTPWSMIEVFLFGVFVAYTKLGDLVHIELEVGVFALFALTVAMLWADNAIDREAVWEAIDRGRSRAAFGTRLPASALACEACTLVSTPAAHPPRCPRCDSRLHARKPDAVHRTWALVIAAAIMYVPANYYPVLTVMQLGAGAPSTILGGVVELVDSGMYPLAALVFMASVAVPMLKLLGLGFMLVATQSGWAMGLRQRTRLYYVVRWIGRWSMIDIFMESLLGALVRFGSAITIEPGMGAVAFCAVVILTMLAAETFDPRRMWDAAADAAPATSPARA